MPLPSPARPRTGRLVAAAGALLLTVVATSAVPATPAQAAPAARAARAALSSAISDGTLEVVTSSVLDTPASDPCQSREPHRAVDERVITDGAQRLEAADAGTWADGTDETDTVSTEGAVRADLTSSVRGDVRTLSMAAALRAGNIAARGAETACTVEVDSLARATFDLEVVRSGYVTVSASTSRWTEASISVFHDDFAVFENLYGTSGSTSKRFWAPAGSYLVFLGAYLERNRDVAGAGAGNRPTTVSGRVSTRLSFTPAGTATGPTTGAGARSVTLPSTLACGSRSAVVRWRGAVARADVARIRVNGRLVRTVRDPKPGGAVVLRGLPPTSRVTISATVGRAAARRTYEACGATGF